ncbi:hypothetical protein PIL02S_02766 [Paenibacillus illinoisensis]|uniref:Uncharacterized protein n=1 Tax=Paenibacillus illinoisensis TaxID=59845 RepID=A0A2W0CDI8_9BACL|nr:hypothetical protein PIL02S_02766 [Paenibacillus illinoisensis]
MLSFCKTKDHKAILVVFFLYHFFSYKWYYWMYTTCFTKNLASFSFKLLKPIYILGISRYINIQLL